MTQDGKNRRPKRRQTEPYEQETVDDLAYAATFAMIGLPVSESTAEHENTMSVDISNDDEIEIEEEEEENVEEKESGKDSGNDHESSTQEIPGNKDAEEDDDDDDDDDDDIDLNVAAMEDETDEAKDPSGDTNAAPKTAHEVDAYNTPIQELEQHLHFRLTVDNSNTPAKARQLNSSNLISAGKVKHYMIHDRTVVVESNPPVNGASLSPLDEGSLLVLKDFSTSNNSLIPLGNIFEVFGPVTRPLYTIRLPATPSIKDSKSASTKSNQQEGSKAFDDPNSSQSDKEKETSNASKPQNKDSKEDTTKEIPDTANADPEPTTPTSIDHWAPNGKYSLLLTTSESVAVYFVQDEARLLDTRNIMRKSGKGCDASNLYDEEVGNGDAMYYSDDEKERQAKSRRKQSGKGQQQQQQHQSNRNPGRREAAVPLGFHQPPPPSGFHNAPTQPPPPPQGFYNQAAQPQHARAQTAYPYPYPETASGAQMPPPPPPPPGRGGPNQPPAYPAPYQY